DVTGRRTIGLLAGAKWFAMSPIGTKIRAQRVKSGVQRRAPANGDDMTTTPAVTPEPTAASFWRSMSGRKLDDSLLDWPPDLFAIAILALPCSEAFGFALSPPRDWPPHRHANWAQRIAEAARQWHTWIEARNGAVPELIAEEWRVFRGRADVPLEELA